MKAPHFAAIILAGGLSTRMKQFKPLLPLGNGTVTDHVISTFRNAGVDVFLVVGHRQEEIKSAINKQGITIIYNPDYEKGMFSSIQAGIRQLPPGYRAFFMLPVDIPLVGQTTIKKILNAGIQHPDNIVYPTYKGKRGHPPLIPASCIHGIMEWNQDGGLKSFLKLHEETALEVPVNDKFVLFDIDTPADYEKLLKQYHLH